MWKTGLEDSPDRPQSGLCVPKDQTYFSWRSFFHEGPLLSRKLFQTIVSVGDTTSIRSHSLREVRLNIRSADSIQPKYFPELAPRGLVFPTITLSNFFPGNSEAQGGEGRRKQAQEDAGRCTEAQGGAGRRREAQGGAGRHREGRRDEQGAQGGAGRRREAQGDAGRRKGAQRGAGWRREAQGGAVRRREAQGGAGRHREAQGRAGRRMQE